MGAKRPGENLAKLKVYFIEATPELLEEKAMRMCMAHGGVLYQVSETGCHTVVSHEPNGAGYARIRRKGRTYFLHHIAWVQSCGPIPDGQRVYQQCGNRCCINPEHMVLGTAAEIWHEAARGRRPEGAALTPMQLNQELVGLIRRLLHFGASKRSITLAFGITGTVFEQIKKGERQDGANV